MTVLFWAFVGYVCGLLPSTWIVASRGGRDDLLGDVRRTIGETDAHVLLSKSAGRAASVAATMDVLKGIVPVLAASRLVGPYDVAACAIGVVAGHCWPVFHYRLAGRGLAAAAGAFLGFLPFEMAVAGIVRVLGSVVRAGGLASTVGYVAIPVVGWLRGQPAPYVFAATAINVLIFARRLEGIGADIAIGLPFGRAFVRRVLFDASALGPR